MELWGCKAMWEAHSVPRFSWTPCQEKTNAASSRVLALPAGPLQGGHGPRWSVHFPWALAAQMPEIKVSTLINLGEERPKGPG